MKYIEFTVQVENSAEVEIAEGVFLSNDITDSAITDPADVKDLLEKKNSYDWDYVDESVLALKDEKPKVSIYRDDTEEDRALLMTLASELRKQLPHCIITRVSADDSDWKDKWKEYFKPTRVTKRLVVKPTWEEYEKKGDELVIEIDPGMAFGTGTHETTSLCLEFIEEYLYEGDSLLDVGSGSGILSIAAGLLGAGDVLGIEIDPEAVKIGQENVAKNGLEDRVRIIEGDLTKGIDYKADVVAANLMADLVKVLSSDVAKYLKPGGIYISSGILKELAGDVGSVIESCGFEILETRVKGDWCAIAARLSV